MHNFSVRNEFLVSFLFYLWTNAVLESALKKARPRKQWTGNSWAIRNKGRVYRKWQAADIYQQRPKPRMSLQQFWKEPMLECLRPSQFPLLLLNAPLPQHDLVSAHWLQTQALHPGAPLGHWRPASVKVAATTRNNPAIAAKRILK